MLQQLGLREFGGGLGINLTKRGGRISWEAKRTGRCVAVLSSDLRVGSGL